MAQRAPVKPLKMFCLFDVDNTLTPARENISNEMTELLAKLRKKGIAIGFVGASNFETLSRQLAPPDGKKVMERFDFGFAENGLTAHNATGQFHTSSFIEFIGEELYQYLADFILGYISRLKLPKKRGVFLELRTNMLHVTPMGRSANDTERKEFETYDKINNVRGKFIKELYQRFNTDGNVKTRQLAFSLAGQISIDIVPKGWDKSYCLQHIEAAGFKDIHFFGDKTRPGGNDYEIFEDQRTTGYPVDDPNDTMVVARAVFGL